MFSLSPEKYLLTAILLSALPCYVSAERLMGPTDMKDWSRGPSCTERDEQAPQQLKQIECNEGEIKAFDGRWMVPNALMNKEFETLETTYKRWTKEDARYPSGISKIDNFCSSLDNTLNGNDMEKFLSNIQSWQSKTQNSPLSVYAEAAFWRGYAWNARGNGYASSVTKEGWALFHQRLERSLEILDRIKSSSTSNPCWHSLKVTVLHEAGAPREAVRKAFLEGVKNFPEYHDIYFSMARSHSPLWGGNAREFDAFVRESVERTSKFEGNGFYARLYWTVDYEHNLPFKGESTVYPDWKKLKSGYLDLLSKYPKSMWNKTRFTVVACRSNDSNLYRQLRTEIDGKIITDVMSLGEKDRCDLKHNWTAPTTKTKQ